MTFLLVRNTREPLAYIGSIEIDDPAQAAEISLEQYGPESKWLEMVAVPHQALTVVFSEESEVSL